MSNYMQYHLTRYRPKHPTTVVREGNKAVPALRMYKNKTPVTTSAESKPNQPPKPSSRVHVRRLTPEKIRQTYNQMHGRNYDFDYANRANPE